MENKDSHSVSLTEHGFVGVLFIDLEYGNRLNIDDVKHNFSHNGNSYTLYSCDAAAGHTDTRIKDTGNLRVETPVFDHREDAEKSIQELSQSIRLYLSKNNIAYKTPLKTHIKDLSTIEGHINITTSVPMRISKPFTFDEAIFVPDESSINAILTLLERANIETSMDIQFLFHVFIFEVMARAMNPDIDKVSNVIIKHMLKRFNILDNIYEYTPHGETTSQDIKGYELFKKVYDERNLLVHEGLKFDNLNGLLQPLKKMTHDVIDAFIVQINYPQ